jgi:hypothetical protein
MSYETNEQTTAQTEQAPDAPAIAQVNEPTTPDPTPDTESPAALVLNVTILERARALPELTGDATIDQAEYAPGSIQRFMDEDGRTMEIVSVGGALRKVALAIDEVAAEA